MKCEAVIDVKFVHAGRSGGPSLILSLVVFVVFLLLTLIGVMLGPTMEEVEVALEYSRIRAHGLRFRSAGTDVRLVHTGRSGGGSLTSSSV